MAREIVIKEWCDLHLATSGEKIEAQPLPPIPPSAGNAAKPRRLSLCPEHWDQLWQPLYDALTEYGESEGATDAAPGERRPSTRGKSAVIGPFKCKVPDCLATPRTLGALMQHIHTKHGIKWTQYRDQHGEPEKLDGSVVVTPRLRERAAVPTPVEDGEPDPWACKEPGCPTGYTARNRKDPVRALGQHRRQVHPDLYAREVVAALDARLPITG